MRNYEVKWEDGALESLSKLDGEIEKKIKDQTEKALSSNPFSNGKPLTGGWEGRWSYRIDFPNKDKSYRAIYEIIELFYRIRGKEVIIAVVKVGERTETGQSDDVYMEEHPHSSLSEIQGKFCQSCAIARIRNYHNWSSKEEKGLELKKKLDLVNDSFGESKR